MQYFIEQVAENGFVLATYSDFTSASDAELFYTSEGLTPITDVAGYRIVNEYGEDVTPTWWVE